jgi:hypothetical protein
MGSNITQGGTGSGRTTALLPTLSPKCSAILASPKLIRTTEDGASFEVDGQWDLPPDIPETIVVECRRWLAAHDAASGIAQEGRIQNWLARLLGGLAGNHTADDVRMKMGAFLFALNDKPAYCFDDATLKIAMRRFKFWPSAGELIEFADEMDQWTRTQAKRAYRVVDAGPRKPDARPNMRPWAEGGAEDNTRWNREQADRERKELIEIMRKRDEEAGRQPGEWDRLPGEDAHAFIDRIGDKRRAMQDEITRRMKGGMRIKPKGADKPVPPPTPEVMKAAYDTTGIKPKDVRTASEAAQNTMSGGEA